MRTLPVLALLLLTLPAMAEPLRGLPVIVDGDTVKVAGQSVRLWGIDAPESAQTCERDGRPYPCGLEATGYLRAMIGGRAVECQERTRDRYRRIVAVCTVAGRDISAAMVEAGWALAFVRYSRDYVAQEERARAARRGMWAGTFVPGWEWRAQKRGGR